MADPAAIFEELSGLDAPWRVESVTTVVDDDKPSNAHVSIQCVHPDDDMVSIRLEMKATDSYTRVKTLIRTLPKQF
jgi:hypothetical protein